LWYLGARSQREKRERKNVARTVCMQGAYHSDKPFSGG
jgi:hypothetical protein